jgi:DNA-binding Lrp family transcriptional regulator
MDEIDFYISMMLMANSRIPYRELADTFNIAVNSIHKRIKSMVEIGIIQDFNTKLNPYYFKAISLFMFGESNTKNLNELLHRVGKNKNVYNVSYASGNSVFVLAYLQNLNELDELVSFVRKEGEIDDLTVGFEKQLSNEIAEINEEFQMSDLDFLIVNSLKDNSRKTISDISYEVGSSAKTVKRYLDRLIENYVINFSIDWHPDKTPIVLSYLIININTSVNLEFNSIFEEIRQKLGNKLLISWPFSNLPDKMVVLIWSSIMQELHNLETSLRSKFIDSVNVATLISGGNFSTWLEDYLDEKVKEIREK